MLVKERKRLTEADNFTILDYIKTSIEILMNMKMEEHENETQTKSRSKHNRSKSGTSSRVISESGSMKSLDEPPKDYEQMLQKYEAEVRNHIKIEQQLKLHIECVQDKLDDSEKSKDKYKKEKKVLEEEGQKELNRYKDLLGLREKEIESLR